MKHSVLEKMTYLVSSLLFIICLLQLLKGAVPLPSTPPVKWKLYSNLWLTWNEAARFCREQGGHLPVTDNPLTFNAFTHWMSVWPRPDPAKQKNTWSGLYKVTPGYADDVFRWERGGAEFSLSKIPVSFWSDQKDEPNNLDTQPCIRMDQSMKTVICNNITAKGLNRVVCEFYEECCSYTPSAHAKATSTMFTSYPNVTSLEGCWEMCESLQDGDSVCLEARWQKEETVCLNATSKSVPTSFYYPGNDTHRQLQHCFVGEEVAKPSTYGYSNNDDSATQIGPSTTPSHLLTCSLILSGADGGTTMRSGVQTDTTLPDTTRSDTTLPDTTRSDTTLPDTTRSDTTLPDTTRSEITMPETTPPDTTLSETSLPDTTLLETTMSDTTLSKSTLPDTTVPETTQSDSASHEAKTSANTQGENKLTTGLPKVAKGKHCPCLCARKPAPTTAATALYIVQRNTTSSYRRQKRSEWVPLTPLVIAITVTFMLTATFFVFFFLCSNVGAVTKSVCVVGTLAFSPSEAKRGPKSKRRRRMRLS